MRIGVEHRGNFKNTETFFKKVKSGNMYNALKPYAELGVVALAAATPKDTGKTAESWNYEIVQARNTVKIYWTNDNVSNGYHVALLIQYGHGVKGGGYVMGRDYINPAMRPVFDEIAENVWKEVTKL